MLAVIGDVVQDIVVWCAQPKQDAIDTQCRIHMMRGGSAANVAAFAATRCTTRFIGCVRKYTLTPVLTPVFASLVYISAHG